jgi:protein ImuA
MRFVTCHNGRLFTSGSVEPSRPRAFTTGLKALDDLLPRGGFGRGVIHEVLSEPKHGAPCFFPLLLARQATAHGAIVWSDPRRELYPPAVAGLGIPLDTFYFLHPRTSADQMWAIAECMGCKGVAATIAPIEKISRVEARRLQLAAERGGGIGILRRRLDKRASIYAAATRWLVGPARGDRTVQRWTIQLIHGHGGRTGGIILEHYRETSIIQAHPLHPPAELADRSAAARASA